MTPRPVAGAVLAAMAVVLGARIGEHLTWAPRTLAALAPLGCLMVAVLMACRAAPARRVTGLLLLATLGAVSMARAVTGLGVVSWLAVREASEQQVTARLSADPVGRWFGVRAPARLEAVGSNGARGTVLIVASGAAATRLRLLETGESAVILGHFRPLEAAERRWRWRHVGAVFEAYDLVGAGGPEPAVLRAANGLRQWVLAGGEALGDTDRSLVAGFLVGDDRGLPARVAADFRAAGLSHLLVVSGANVSLALALMAPLLRRFGLLGRLAGGLATLVIFAAMTRFEPSVLRAGAMSGLALLASFLGRPVAGVRILALAVAGLVLIDPFLVHSLGFGLSTAASAGILLLAGPIGSLLPGPRFIREVLAVTTAAQIGVAPIAFPAFGQLPLVALPANLAAAPAAAALSLWGLGSGVVAGSLRVLAGSADAGPLAVLQIPTALLAQWIRTVARVAARFPIMIGPRPAVLCALALAAVTWRLRVRRRLGGRPRGRGDDPAPTGRARRSGGQRP
ncbi:MAG TPA: ComEC/Rec2 family competence protein [Acidimicrobiia bacterium]|nr:ComEC/Rec2 family competence protein [Acidimicrobiia bacterium]